MKANIKRCVPWSQVRERVNVCCLRREVRRAISRLNSAKPSKGSLNFGADRAYLPLGHFSGPLTEDFILTYIGHILVLFLHHQSNPVLTSDKDPLFGL